MSETSNHWAPGAASLQAMTDEQFLVAWHEAVCSGDEARLELIEGNAQHRFHVGDWRARYVASHPQQTRYPAAK